MRCVVTGVERRESPEELVRQAIAAELIQRYGYRREDMQLELPIQMGSSKDARADLVIFRPETEPARRTQGSAYIIVECKRAGISNGAFENARMQLESYMATCRNCHYGMVVAGNRRASYRMTKSATGELLVEPVMDIPPAAAPRPRFTVVTPGPMPSHAGTQPTEKKPVPRVVLGGALAMLILGGTCTALLAGRARSDSAPFESPGPGAPGARQCTLASWDGASRGWAKLGSAQCSLPGAMTGYYLRVAFDDDKAGSQHKMATAWGAYVNAHLGGGACPPAREMAFFDASGQTGAGILFREMPPGWEAVLRQKPDWRLIDGRNQPVTTQVCFFPASEARRPPGW